MKTTDVNILKISCTDFYEAYIGISHETPTCVGRWSDMFQIKQDNWKLILIISKIALTVYNAINWKQLSTNFIFCKL